MSATFHLVCHETRQTLWIGQGHGSDFDTFYSGEPATMLMLGAFLKATKGRPLVVMGEHEIDANPEWEGYEEFKP